MAYLNQFLFGLCWGIGVICAAAIMWKLFGLGFCH
jgi:hypothetical protein